jgi:hypothetical protein
MNVQILPFKYVAAFSDVRNGAVYLNASYLDSANFNHEIAHISSGDPDHGEKFRFVAADLGVEIPTVDLFKEVRKRIGIPSYWAANIGNICVDEAAPVWTASGPKPLADVVANELVYSFNPITGMLELVRVVANLDNGTASCIAMRANGHTSMVTPNHTYWTITGRCSAINVPGRQLLAVDDPASTPRWGHYGNRPRIAQAGMRYVRDLHVPPFHNYVVNGAVVGNSGIQNMLLDYHLLQAYRKFSSKILGTEGHWEVLGEGGPDGPTKQLIRLYPTPKGVFPVVVLYYPVVTHFRSPQARKLANDMLVAEAKIMLGHARRKIAGMPGPTGGNIGLDGADLITEGTKLREDLTKNAMEMGEPLPIQMWGLLPWIIIAAGSAVHTIMGGLMT